MALSCATTALFLIICFSFDYIMNHVYNTLGPSYSAGWVGHFFNTPLPPETESNACYISLCTWKRLIASQFSMGFYSDKIHHHDAIGMLAIIAGQIIKEPIGNLWQQA